MAAAGFFLGTLAPGILALLSLFWLIAYARIEGRRAPLWLPLVVLLLWLWVAHQLNEIHNCEKYGRCDGAPAWCRDGLRELRAAPGGCAKWGPVGCVDAGGGAMRYAAKRRRRRAFAGRPRRPTAAELHRAAAALAAQDEDVLRRAQAALGPLPEGCELHVKDGYLFVKRTTTISVPLISFTVDIV